MNLKEKLNQYKKIKVCGMSFTIRKINPLQDFASNESMPQIFTYYITKRKVKEDNPFTMQSLQKALNDMKAIIKAGVVDPPLVPVEKDKSKENGITVDDLFVDEEMGAKLYIEILTHSLNRFKGLKGLFFSTKIKHYLYTEWQKNITNFQVKSYSEATVQ